MPEYEQILYEPKGPIAYLTLNRPEKLNALSNELRGEMVHALKKAEFDPAVGGRTRGQVEPRKEFPDIHPQGRPGQQQY